MFFTPFNTAIETQALYTLVQMRAGFGPRNRRWELAMYLRNLTNQGVHYRHEQPPATCVHRPARRIATVGHAVYAAPLSRESVLHTRLRIAEAYHIEPSLNA